MPDTQEQRQQEELRAQQEHQQFGQDPTQQFSAADIRSQLHYDTVFGEQVFGDTATREINQSYWQQAEEAVRQARRISEIYAMSVMQNQLIQKISQVVVPHLTQQLTPLITRQVVQQLQSNPQLIKPVVQQAMTAR